MLSPSFKSDLWISLTSSAGEAAMHKATQQATSISSQFFPVGFFRVLDFGSLAGCGDAVAIWDLWANPLPTNLGLKEYMAKERGDRLLSPGYVLHWVCGCLFRPPFLLQPSPSIPDLPWQSGLTPAAYQRTLFVLMPLKPPLQFTTLSLESSSFIQHMKLCVQTTRTTTSYLCLYTSANTKKPRFNWAFSGPLY